MKTLTAILVLAATGPAALADDFFEREIRPLLVEKCQSCHGDKKVRGGLKLTARETVRFFAACYDLEVDELALLRQVELEERARQPQAKLSGGQRQRLSIATALVNQPQVLFLDEPTTGLDPQARRNLWDLIRSIQARGTTVFLTTHYLDEAEILCDRVAIMDEGNIVALDPPRKLIDDLLARGFTKPVLQQKANLEDVFLDLTGHEIRDA